MFSRFTPKQHEKLRWKKRESQRAGQKDRRDPVFLDSSLSPDAQISVASRSALVQFILRCQLHLSLEEVSSGYGDPRRGYASEAERRASRKMWKSRMASGVIRTPGGVSEPIMLGSLFQGSPVCVKLPGGS